jgi:1A family penicillin-binding protein
VATSRPGVWARRHWLLAGTGTLALIVCTMFIWAASCGLRGCPSTSRIQAFRPTEGSRILDRRGVAMGRLTYVRRINVPLDQVPKQVRAAFVATEDRRFYRHDGVDWRSAARAAWENLRHFEVREGFSTITMQVVRNAFFPGMAQERTLRRKLIELGMASRLERALTKQQILELYLNVIYLGNGTYGVEAASRDLFGRSVGRLSLAQAATLAALPKGPSAYAPRRHPDRALARRNLVLSLMAEQGYISATQAAAARREPLGLVKDGWRPRNDESYALDPVRAIVDSVLGDRADELGDVTVYTTLDATAQRAAERAVRTQGDVIQRAATARNGRAAGEVEGALVAIDPADGEIRALVGSRRLQAKGFNRALAARRQPGSAFKPFVFAAALGAGFTPATVLDDSPVELESNDGQIWRPANYGGDYGGNMTLRRALMRSANAATVRLWQQVGDQRVIALARRAGITSPMEPNPSLALGALEVTPLELANAYAPFANGGLRVRPSLVRRIEASDGSVLWRMPAQKVERVLDAREAFQLTSMLQSVVDGGTAYVVRELGIRGAIAGKTGTTNNGADVWFVGYTPTLVAAVWFGYDAPRAITANASGSRLAAPAWASFYRNGWKEGAGRGWPEPDGMVTVEIDGENGLIANEFCPITYREYFKAGTEPTEECHEHHGDFFDELEGFGRRVGGALKRVLGL